MNRKLILIVGLVVLALVAVAVLVTLTQYRGPSGAATGESGGCGGDPVAEELPNLEIPVTTETAVVEGNVVLNQANATVKKEIMGRAQVGKNLGLEDEPIDSVFLRDFKLQVTNDSVEGPEDVDDLKFVKNMTVYVRSLNPDSGLQDAAVAWYYAEEAEDDGTDDLKFQVSDDIDLAPYVEDGFELYSESFSGHPIDDVSLRGTALFSAYPGGR